MLDETTKSAPAAKSDAKSTSGGTSGGDAAPTNYSRGEGQKLVTHAYRENWLAIFGKPARTTASPKRATKTAKRKPAAKAKAAAKNKTKRKGRR